MHAHGAGRHAGHVQRSAGLQIRDGVRADATQYLRRARRQFCGRADVFRGAEEAEQFFSLRQRAGRTAHHAASRHQHRRFRDFRLQIVILLANRLRERIARIVEPGQPHLIDLHRAEVRFVVDKSAEMIVVLMRADQHIQWLSLQLGFHRAHHLGQPRFRRVAVLKGAAIDQQLTRFLSRFERDQVTVAQLVHAIHAHPHRNLGRHGMRPQYLWRSLKSRRSA